MAKIHDECLRAIVTRRNDESGQLGLIAPDAPSKSSFIKLVLIKKSGGSPSLTSGCIVQA